jgi:hypothetical protein
MFKIIGGDGREYGPVSAAEILGWISVGRANAETKARREGENDWSPLSSFPEFADSLASKPPQFPLPLPEPPPGKPAADPNELSREVLARQVEVSIGSCLGRAWDLLKSDFWPVIGVSALVLFLVGAANALYVGIVVSGPLLGGLFHYYLKRVRGQTAQLNDIFAGFSNFLFLNLFLGVLVALILTSIGILCCILPGIYLAVAWHFTLPLVIDTRLGFWEAMEVSRKVITARWWMMFGFVVICGLINVGGTLACGIGVFVTWPWTMLALVFFYDDLFGSSQAKAA